MITIRNIELKTELTEFTVQEFEKIMIIQNDDKIDVIDGLLETIVIAGLKDENILAELTFEELRTFEKSLTIASKDSIDSIDFVKEITIGNRTYKSFNGDTYIATAKDAGYIERIVKQKGFKYIVEAMAYIFKDDQLSHKEHNDPAHIKYKMSLFADQPAIIAIPFIIYIVKEVIDKMGNQLTDESIENVLEEYETIKKSI